MDSAAFLRSIDADLQRFFNEYFVDTDSDDVEFEGFTPEYIRGQPVYLINLCRDRIDRLPPLRVRQPHRHRHDTIHWHCRSTYSHTPARIKNLVPNVRILSDINYFDDVGRGTSSNLWF